MKNRIAQVRRRHKVSQQELADRIGATLSMVGKLERSERELTLTWIEKIAGALDTNPALLLDASEEVLEAGFVNSDGTIVPPEQGWRSSAPIEKIKELAVAVDAARQSIQVQGSPLSITIPPGSVLVYESASTRKISSNLGRLCVIQLRGQDDRALAYLAKGPYEGAVLVVMAGGRLAEGVDIEWASPVLEIKLPKMHI